MEKIANSFANESEDIIEKMEKLILIGLKALDALHISCAIYLNCDYFVTVDKGIIKKSHEISEIKIINPINLILELEL